MRNQGRGISPHALGLRRVSGPIHRNAAPSTLIQLAMETDGCSVASTGALLAYSGKKCASCLFDYNINKWGHIPTG